MKILVTGGAGFIGSNFIDYLLSKYPDYQIVNLDALTYAGNLENLKKWENDSRYTFVKGDVLDKNLVDELVKQVSAIVHFAAETHVDRSILDADSFIKTNFLGTYNLLEAARTNNTRFHHISTDEVFGSLGFADTPFNEDNRYDPRSPYSSSKAAADHLVRAYFHTYKLPITISNCSNNYGPYQFPEKLIPLFATNLIDSKKVPLYGDGRNVRDWIHVLDHCRAIDLILHQGCLGETYCIGGDCERNNKEITYKILELMGRGEEMIEFVKDRPGHDLRYAIDSSKIKRELGWRPEFDFEAGIKETVEWYRKNESWWRKIKDGSYKEYYEKQYGNRGQAPIVSEQKIETIQTIESAVIKSIINDNRLRNSADGEVTRGIILAGGSATRLYPSTIVTSKQLLPVYDRPMIFYPLNVLIKAGINDILMIVSPEHSGHFVNLLGSILDSYGIQVSFKVQTEPRGLPEAFILGENHIDNNNVALILGDNIFEDDFSVQIKQFKSGGQIFVKKVPDPERFGVIKFGADIKPEAIVEKPKQWVSDYAITGLYLYDHHVVEVAKNLKPSARGELEIVDLHNHYLGRNELKTTIFEGAWLDAGTHDALLEASVTVKEKGINKKFAPVLEQAAQEFCVKQQELMRKKTLSFKLN
jgi:dTDP-glucose 4,6-dehydratase